MELLNDIIIIFGFAALIIIIFERIQVPAIVGYLLTGALIGPHGLGLVQSVHAVEIMAEVGIIMLLFTIGIEFSIHNLFKMRRTVILGGGLQVGMTIAICVLIFHLLGISLPQAIFFGFLVSLSSTAIVLRIIQKKVEVDSPQGRINMGILIFQDIIIVPMMLLTPVLAGQSGEGWGDVLILIGKILAVFLFIIITAKWIVPRLLFVVAKTKDREVFLIVIILICFSVAWVTSQAKLSLALGAFISGLIISESEYSHQALGSILPFRDVFASFFFISMGMLLNVDFLFQHWQVILMATAGILLLKTLTALGSVLILGYPLRIAVLVGVYLSQIGEFSFSLARTGVENNILTPDYFQYFLAISLLTMVVTPFFTAIGPTIANYCSHIQGVFFRRKIFSDQIEGKTVNQRNHLIIIGFGLNGRNLARAAKSFRIPYIIIEMNPETVHREKEKEPIFFGDATEEEVLHYAGVCSARIVVITIPDAVAARRSTEIIRRLNPQVQIIVRTRYVLEVKPLLELGADEVIPEEFETSVEIFSRVMRRYLIPHNEIEKIVNEIRSGNYQRFRSESNQLEGFDLPFCLPDVDIKAFRINKDSPLANKTLEESGLRKDYGVTAVAISRRGETISNPDANMQLLVGDVLLIIGDPEKMSAISMLFTPVK